MSEIIIEKDVPVPPGKYTTSWGRVAEKMETGDSVGELTSYCASKLRHALSTRGKLCCSRKEDKTKGTYRVWCLGAKP